MQRPPRDHADPSAIDESTDAYDTIEWMLKNVAGNNGRVGMLGISYGGWLMSMALLDPHPALKAASEQASPGRHVSGRRLPPQRRFPPELRLRIRGDDGNRQGGQHAISLSTAPTRTSGICDLGALSNVNEKYFHGKMPTWNDFVEHPNYDEFWQKQAFRALHQRLAQGAQSQRGAAGGTRKISTARSRSTSCSRSPIRST